MTFARAKARLMTKVSVLALTTALSAFEFVTVGE